MLLDANGIVVSDVATLDAAAISFLSCRACLNRDRPVRFLCSGKPVDVTFAVGAVGGRGVVIGRSETSFTKSRPGKGVEEDVAANGDCVQDGSVGSSSSSGTSIGKRSPMNCIVGDEQDKTRRIRQQERKRKEKKQRKVSQTVGE